MGGFRKGTDSKGKQTSTTEFPTNFLGQFSRTYGRGVGFDELLNALPRTRSLFGGQQVGIFPNQQQGGGGYGRTNYYDASPGSLSAIRDAAGVTQRALATGGAGANAGTAGRSGGVPGASISDIVRAAGGGGAQQQQAAYPGWIGGADPPERAPAGGLPTNFGGSDRRFSLEEINSLVQSQYANNPGLRDKTIRDLGQIYSQGGFADQGGITVDQLRAAAPSQNPFRTGTLPSLLEQYAAAQGNGEQRFVSSGSDVGGPDTYATLQRLGFYDPKQYGTANIRELPKVGVPGVNAAQSQFAPRGFDALERSIFESQYDPVAREINRQGELEDRRLDSDLANRGLAGSGTGVGQLQDQRRERNQQLYNAAQDAASAATTARFGYEYQQREADAARQQQANLARSGFAFDAQVQNADNVLRGDVARADNYLRTIGVNQDAAQKLRADFLQVMNLQQADLERMDNFQLQNLSVLLNNWLQQGALLSNIGRTSTGSQSVNQPDEVNVLGVKVAT